MGKRSSFERFRRDFYPTPREAVEPLLPHLDNVYTFAEPCAGDRSLIAILQAFGLKCVYEGDIVNGQDALTITDYRQPDRIITNPPHLRSVLHPMILHFQSVALTWLLIDSDWASTQQAEPYLSFCTDIVPIGRVKWIEGSKFTGKDNYAWYHFDGGHREGPLLHARGIRFKR